MLRLDVVEAHMVMNEAEQELIRQRRALTAQAAAAASDVRRAAHPNFDCMVNIDVDAMDEEEILDQGSR